MCAGREQQGDDFILRNMQVHFAALVVNYGISNTIVLEIP